MRWIRKRESMKKFLALLLTALTLLSLVACTSEPLKDAKGNTIYRENVVDFTLYIPETWILDTTSFVVSAHASKDDASTVTMTQADLSGYHEIPAIFASTKDELAKLYTFKTLEEATQRKIADTDAAVYHYSLTDKQTDVVMHYLQYMFIKNGVLYTFTYYATPELFESHLEEVDKMLDAITFGKGTAPKGMIEAVSAGSRDVDCSDFTIQIPEDWSVDTSTGVFTAMGPAGDATCLNIMRTTVSKDTSPVQYYEDNKDSLKEGLSDFAVVELKKDFITKDASGKSHNAVTVEYTATVSGQAYHFKQLFFVNDTTVYLVTFSAPEGLYDTHIDAINKCIASFTPIVK